jgi:hypothetical protein
MNFLKYLFFNRDFNGNSWVEPYWCLSPDYLKRLENLKIIDLLEILNENPLSSHYNLTYIRVKLKTQ